MLTVQILLDDADERRHVEACLSATPYRPMVVPSWEDLLASAPAGEGGALIVDAHRIDEMRRLRGAGGTLPVLALTQIGSTPRGAALAAGADDTLAVPFSTDELFARLVAISSPITDAPDPVLPSDTLVLDAATYQARCHGRPVPLGRLQFALLEQLMHRPGQVVTRTMLLERVWKFDFEPQSDIVACHMTRLREQLRQASCDLAITTSGQGYRLQIAS